MQEVLGLCEAKNGTKIDELLQGGASEHKRAWQYVETNSNSRRRQGSRPRGNKGKVEGQKEYQRNKFEMEGFMAQKGLWNLARNKALQDRGALPREEGDAIREFQAMREENFLSSWLREDGKK